MSNDYREFLRLLNCRKVKYVIVGAHAVVAHSRPRATGDLDVLIDNSEKNAENIVAVLKEFGFGSLGLKITDFCKPGFVGCQKVKEDYKEGEITEMDTYYVSEYKRYSSALSLVAKVVFKISVKMRKNMWKRPGRTAVWTKRKELQL